MSLQFGARAISPYLGDDAIRGSPQSTGELAMDLATEAFAATLLTIAAAEFADKTQLGLMLLAASLRKPAAIFFGMIAGFAVVAGAGVAVGQVLLTVVPLSVLTTISGLMFVIVGLLMLRIDVQNDVATKGSGGPFRTALLLIVLTEMGDKTQIVTVALSVRFAQPLLVFTGALVAFAVIDGLSIMLASTLGKRLPTERIRRVSAIIFIVLGILTLIGFP